MSSKRMVIWVLVWMLLLAGTPTVFAAAGERVPWQVEGFGTFYVPGDWQAAEIDLKKPLPDGKKAEDVLNAAAVDMPNGQVKPADKLNSLDIRAFQVTLNDGSAYHLAWLIFFRDIQKMPAEARKFFAEEVTEERKAQINGFVSGVNRSSTEKAYNDPQTKVGLKLVEMVPVEFLKMNKKQAFAGGGRVLVTSEGMVFPLYGKGYVFDAKGYMAFAMLVTFDGERIFWDPVLHRVMTSLNRR